MSNGQSGRNTRISGAAGENHACRYLERLGYAILARNWHSRYGEVDIIAAKGDALCFVEVKARREGSMVSGEAAVGKAKQRKIIMTALHYIKSNAAEQLQPRFDVCVVTMGKGGAVSGCELLEAAFDGSAYE